eukprot:129142_1
MNYVSKSSALPYIQMTDENKDNSESNTFTKNTPKTYLSYKTKKAAFLHCEWDQLTKFNKTKQICTIALHQELVNAQGMTHESCLNKTRTIFKKNIAKTSILSKDAYPFIDKIDADKNKFSRNCQLIKIVNPEIRKHILAIAPDNIKSMFTASTNINITNNNINNDNNNVNASSPIQPTNINITNNNINNDNNNVNPSSPNNIANNTSQPQSNTIFNANNTSQPQCQSNIIYNANQFCNNKQNNNNNNKQNKNNTDSTFNFNATKSPELFPSNTFVTKQEDKILQNIHSKFGPQNYNALFDNLEILAQMSGNPSEMRETFDRFNAKIKKYIRKVSKSQSRSRSRSRSTI